MALMRQPCVKLQHSLTFIKRNYGENGMNISPQSARVDDNTLWVELRDGRAVGVVSALAIGNA